MEPIWALFSQYILVPAVRDKKLYIEIFLQIHLTIQAGFVSYKLDQIWALFSQYVLAVLDKKVFIGMLIFTWN